MEPYERQRNGIPAAPEDGGATKESDLYFIRIGDERYEIPDAVILGE